MPPVYSPFPGQLETTAPTLGPGNCPIPFQYHLGSGGVSFLVCMQTTGAMTISRGFRDDSSPRVAKSCADLGQHGADVPQTETQAEYLAPSPYDGVVRPDGHDMEVSFSLDPYTGPGTHPISLDVGGYVVIDQTTYSLNDYGGNHASASMTTNADGSGSLTATSLLGATLGTTEPVGTLNLSITWSCVPNYE